MSSPGATGQEAIAARRGDLAIVQQHHSGAGQGRGPYDTFTVGQVTGITRDGQVRVIRPAGMLAGETDRAGLPLPGMSMERAGNITAVHVIPARRIDVEGAMATAACHVWDGDCRSRPFDSIEEIGGQLRPHLTSGRPGAQDQLRTAARSRDAAAREAHAALLADGSYGDYKTAICAANDAYRNVYAAATGQQPLAAGRLRDAAAEAEAGPG